jgi:nucleotide-binding universal stress UspA family protein
MTELDDPTPVRRALICLGGTELEPSHLKFTGELLRILSFTPVLACIADDKDPDDLCDKQFERAAQFLGTTTYEKVIMKDKPERAILRQLNRGKYDLLVLGAAECAPGSHLHTLKQRLVQKSKTNVLVVQNPPDKIEHILVCTGGHKMSETAVLTSLELADACQSELTILHIVTAAPSMYAGLEAQDESLEQVLARQYPLSDHLHEMSALAEKRGIDAIVELRHGVVIEEILRTCDMNRCDLVVVGTTKPKAFLNRLVLGRVSPQLISSSDRSLLIVRKPIEL